MRVGLIGEGTYPVVKGGVSTWADLLVGQLSEIEFHLVQIVGKERASVWDLGGNVSGLTTIAMWDPPGARRPLRWVSTQRQLRQTHSTLHDLWAALLPGTGEADLAEVENALRPLARSSPQRLSWVLRQQGSTEALLSAWTRHRERHPELPELTGGQAAQVARNVDRALATMDAQWPEVDLINVTANGPSALVSLVRHWRDGTPIVMTEHGVYLRERYLAVAAAGWPWPVRYALMTFTRAVCQVAYELSTALAPVSQFNGRWEQRLGTSPERIQPIPNGVDPDRYQALTDEPTTPTVSWVGRIDPLKDLETLIRAFDLAHRQLPDANLRLFGPTPAGNEAYRAQLEQLVSDLGLTSAVQFEGPAPSAIPAIEAGQVVALSSKSEGMPFTVIEAMMSGRPTVSTDVGGVAEITGRDGTYGLLVPPRDPAALADALVTLLNDAELRQRMGRAARQRALADFTIQAFSDRYRQLYHATTRPTAATDLGPRRALAEVAA